MKLIKNKITSLTGVFALSLLAFFLILITPFNALAANYGEGNYGDGDYGIGGTPTPAPVVPLTQSSAPTCSSTTPTGNSPWIYSASSNDSSSIILKFVNYQTPITHFVIEYGIKSGEYKYSVDNISKDSSSYTITKLNPSTTYFFRIRSGNDCTTGSWSNEISSKTLGFVTFNNLDTTASELEPVAIDDDSNVGSCKTYTVKSGDTLWKVASNLLDDGSRYQEIVNENSNKYPELKTSNTLKVGWELKVNCDNSKTDAGTNNGKSDDEANTGGYDVNIKVTNTDKEPVKGAKVTLHSTPREATTDENGVASFTNVESGDHKVLIAYNNFEGEQSINLSGSSKEFNLNITVTEKKVMFSKTAYIIIGLLVLVITVLVIKLQKKKNIKKIF
ncbi:MAG: carboxypeptidase regulatory-like domain-containing protein [Microgenomates group bacterium]